MPKYESKGIMAGMGGGRVTEFHQNMPSEKSTNLRRNAYYESSTDTKKTKYGKTGQDDFTKDIKKKGKKKRCSPFARACLVSTVTRPLQSDLSRSILLLYVKMLDNEANSFELRSKQRTYTVRR